MTPAAASRPCRTTCTAQPVLSRRAATSSSQPVSARSRWVRAAPRRKETSRSRQDPASSNRWSSASAVIRIETDATTGSEPASSDARSRSTTAAYAAGATLPLHGDRHLPISASAQALSAGTLGIRPPHCRIGNASCSAATDRSAARLEE